MFDHLFWPNLFLVLYIYIYIYIYMVVSFVVFCEHDIIICRYYTGPVNSVVFGDFTGLEKIDNSVRTNALFFLIVVSNSFSLGDSIGGLGKNV